MKAAAIFDALCLVEGITSATTPRSSGPIGATEQEIHAFGYLARLLTHWTQPQLSWGYDFHSTSRAEPFAPELSFAIQALLAKDALREHGVLLSLTAAGGDLRQRLGLLIENEQRLPALVAVASAATLLPTTSILQALTQVPMSSRTANRVLFDETTEHVLDEHYDALKEVVGHGGSLLGLAESWLQYLLAVRQDAA